MSADAVRGLHRRIEQLEFALAQQQQQTQISIVSAGVPAVGNLIPIANVQDENHTMRSRQTAQDLSSTRSRVAQAATAKALPEVEISATQIKLLGRNWYFKGMQLLSKTGLEWIASRTGQPSAVETLSFKQFEALPTVSTLRQQHSHKSFGETHELPEKSKTEGVVQYLVNSKFAKTYPILDQQLVVNAIDTAYESTDLTLQQAQISAKACVWALQAVASRLNSTTTVLKDGERCASRAHALLHLVEESSIAALQAILLLVS